MKNYSNVMIRVVYIWILYIIYKYCLDTFVFGISFTAKLIFVSLFIVAYIFDLLDFTEQKFRIRHIIYFFVIDAFFAGMFYSLVRTVGMFITFGILFLVQVSLKWVIQQFVVKRYKVIIYGHTRNNSQIIRSLIENIQYEYIGFVSGERTEESQYLGTIEEVEEIIRMKNIDKIIITTDRLNDHEMDVLLNFKVNGIDIVTYKEFNEQIEQKIDITYIDKIWLLESMGFEILHNTTQQKIKRLFDIIFSIVLLIVFSPVMLITGIIIKLTSKGSVFFKQKRLGLKNVEFEIIKFRSMRIHDQNEFSKYADENDPRVTKFGKFIRKTRIDELPQLICILKGEMSFVGPRPEWNELCYEYMKNIPYYNLRHLIKPGVTGWAQVMYPYGISMEDAYRKLEYDLYYMKHQDIMMDLKIVFRTVKIVIFAKGM